MTLRRINGNLYSWASITIRVDSTLISNIKSITYGDARNRAKGYGAGRQFGPIGQTSGKYETEKVVCTIEKQELTDLRKALADRAGSDSFGDSVFQIVVQYDESGRHITDVIDGCSFSKNSSKADDGGDPLYEDVEFDCLSISWNGVTLYAAQES